MTDPTPRLSASPTIGADAAICVHAHTGPDGIAPQWRKSTRCGASNTCVETARDERGVLVRDSADPAGPILALTPAAWAGLLDAIKREIR